MDIPFRKTPGATTDLVKDYDFREHYSGVNMNTPWADIKPYIRQAVRTYVLPYLGETLFTDITTKILAATESGVEVEFSERLQDVVAHYAIMVALPKRKTILTSMGAIENTGADGTTSSSLWGFKTTLWAVAQDADKMMDELLAWMETKVEASESYFVTNWSNTAAYDAVSSGWFRYTSEFQEFHSIHTSFRNFKRLVPIIQECAERHILPILCQDEYDALLTAIKENNATAAQAKLIKQVRRALAKHAVYEASMQLSVLADQEAFRVISNIDAVDQRAYASDVTQTAIQGMRESAQRSASAFTAELVDFLYTNKDDYPTWEASDCNKLNNTDDPVSIYKYGPGGVFL